MTTTTTHIDIASGREDAFAELVRRHAGWVYGVAQRRLHDAHLAEDAVQATFALLFCKSPAFAAEPAAVAWLHRTVSYASANILRSERRRRKREHEANEMRKQAHDPEASEQWAQLAPMLDELIEKLSKSDREAILLRFYRQMSHEQVAAALGVSEEAARKRVTRAVERLRKLAGAGGTTMTAAALTALLVAHTATPAPAGLAAATITVGLSGASGSAIAGGAVASAMNGAQAMFLWSQVKVAAVVLLIATGVSVAGLKLVTHLRAGNRAAIQGLVGRLSDGATIELLAVGRRSDQGPTRWWSADGAHAPAVPYGKIADLQLIGAAIFGDGTATDRYELAYRRWVDGPGATNVSWTYSSPDAAGGGSFGMRPLAERDGAPVDPSINAAVLTVPRDRSAVTIRGELTTAEWNTLYEFAIDAELQVVVQRADTPQPATPAVKLGGDGRLFVSMGYENPTGDPNTSIDQRLIVIAEDGRRSNVYMGKAAHNGKVCVAVTSLDQPLVPRGKQRRTLQFQVRPFDRWIEFRNVSLKPDRPTRVQVVTSESPTYLGKLKSGPSVELLGVTFDKPISQAWRADGSPIELPLANGARFDRTKHPGEPKNAPSGIVLALRVDPKMRDGGIVATESSEPWYWLPVDERGQSIPDMAMLFAGGTEPGATTATHRFNFATGPWEATGLGAKSAELKSPSEPVTVIPHLTKPESDRGGAYVAVIGTPDGMMKLTGTGTVLRLCARDASGKTVIGTAFQPAGAPPNRVEYGFLFAESRPEELTELWLERRPASEWIEFRNLSLKPGQKTNVQVVTSDEDQPPRSSRFEATLPNGAKIELAGVCDRAKGEWWAMDGTPLAEAPAGPDDPSPGEVFGQPMALGVVVRVTDMSAGESQWSANGRNGSAAWAMDKLYRPGNGRGQPDVQLLKLAPATREAEAAGLTIRVAAASGAWDTKVRRVRGNAGWPQPRDGGEAARDSFRPFERNGRAMVTTHTARAEISARVVAVLDDGSEDIAQPSDRGPTDTVWAFECPLASVREFSYQERPFDQWVEFRDIALHGGAHSNAKVVTSSSGATSAPAPGK